MVHTTKINGVWIQGSEHAVELGKGRVNLGLHHIYLLRVVDLSSNQLIGIAVTP